MLTSAWQDGGPLCAMGCGVIFCRETEGKGTRWPHSRNRTTSAFGLTRDEKTPFFQSQLVCRCMTEHLCNLLVWWVRLERCLLVRFTKSRSFEQLSVCGINQTLSDTAAPGASACPAWLQDDFLLDAPTRSPLTILGSAAALRKHPPAAIFSNFLSSQVDFGFSTTAESRYKKKGFKRRLVHI